MKIVIGGKDDFSQDEIIEKGKWEFNFKANNIVMNEATKIYSVSRYRNVSKDPKRIKVTPIVLFDLLYDKNIDYKKKLEKYSTEINIEE